MRIVLTIILVFIVTPAFGESCGMRSTCPDGSDLECSAEFTGDQTCQTRHTPHGGPDGEDMVECQVYNAGFHFCQGDTLGQQAL